MTCAVVALALPFLWFLPAAASDTHASKIAGTWQTKDNPAHSWTFEQTDKGLHVIETDGGRTISDYVCDTLGRDCDVKRNGHDAKVSLWYNGPKLVEMVTEGAHAVKRRYAVSADGADLGVEIIPVVPEGRSETLTLLRRGELQTARQRE